jgi:hypothetical protein
VERLYVHTDTLKTPAALFAPEYQGEMKSLLRSNWKYLSTFGPVQSVDMVGYQPEGNSATLTYRIRHKVGSRIVSIRRNSSGKITLAEDRME